MPINLDHLNSAQRAAVLHHRGPLLILAGAGSGKTLTMTYRIAWLIKKHGVSPSGILGLSFTNKAAKELNLRVRKICKTKESPLVTTFHSLCVRILKEHAQKLGYHRHFTIVDTSDQIEILRSILKKINIDDKKFDPKSILFQISNAKNQLKTNEELISDIEIADSAAQADDYQIALIQALPHYIESLKALNAMDFDDLLINTIKLLRNFPIIRKQLQETYKYILIDEYQDTNRAQFEIIRSLTETRQNLCVVGDDDQSIYAWRGADPTHILSFSKHYPQAEKIVLDQNYRSTEKILNCANQVISKNRYRYDKKLKTSKGPGESVQILLAADDRSEAEVTAEEIIRLTKIYNWKDIAVLIRSNPQTRVIEEVFREMEVPYELVGSYSFMDRKEIRDTLAYWKLLTNPNDSIAFRRIINWPPRGIGKTSLISINQISENASIPLYKAAQQAELSTRAKSGLDELLNYLRAEREYLRKMPPDPSQLSVWARSMIDRLEFKHAMLEEQKENPAHAQKRWENTLEIANAVGFIRMDLIPKGKRMKSGLDLLSDYLDKVMLDAQDSKDEEDKTKEKNKVHLMTLHSSKGLEFPVVFMLGMDDGLFPHRRVIEEARDLDEERRLCYVGLTRAKEVLFLVRCKNRIRWGKAVPQNRSRFFDDIPENQFVLNDRSNAPTEMESKRQEEHEKRVTGFLSQICANLE